ncbi:MAG TPA: hypothetical protein VGI39_01520 [Polyangiaceae bacterium]|jgi:hypothetical protein
MSNRDIKVGQAIVFIDGQRERHDALVTRTWESLGGMPGVNLVLVSSDEAKGDPYGRQIERHTSIVHLSVQPAGAFCWCLPTE